MNIHIKVKSLAALPDGAVTCVPPNPPRAICWAESSGSCSAKGSREHLITAGSIKDRFVSIEGASWCQGHTLFINKKRFTSRILCKHHNQVLNRVDDEGSAALEIFETMFDNPTTKTQTINGLMLERWLMKQLINLELVENFALRPPSEMLDIVFQRGDAKLGAGLYFAQWPGDSVGPQKGDIHYLRQVDSFDGQGKITGGLFILRGTGFLLSIVQYPPDTTFRLTSSGRSGPFLYRPHTFHLYPNTNQERFVQFTWSREETR